jgi:polar amino acid transport system substrate-binding protein
LQSFLTFRFLPNRIVAAALIVGAAALLGGCAALQESDSPVVDRIRKSGTLRVGMAGDTPPLNATDLNGRLMGLEVDLAVDLGNAMGVEAIPVKLPFGDLLPALERGDVDVVLSNMTMTTERNTRVAFVGPYLISGKAVLTRSAELAEADEPADLDVPALKVAALRGSTSERLLREVADDAEVVAVDAPGEGVAQVIEGGAQAMLADLPIVLLALLRNPDAGLLGVTAPLTYEPIGVALPAGDALFENLIRNRIILLEESGVLEVMRLRWFTQADWLAVLED